MDGKDENEIDNEVRAIQKICHSRHPNIVEVISTCKHVWKGSPACFIQMELCDGDMESYVRFRHQLGGSIDIAEIADTMVQILDGLVYLHSHDEVHRDLKPKNGTHQHENTFDNIFQFCTSTFGLSHRPIQMNQLKGCGRSRILDSHLRPNLDINLIQLMAA